MSKIHKNKSVTLHLEGIIPSLEDDKEAYEGLNARAQAFVSLIGLKLPEQPMHKTGTPIIPSLPKDSNGRPSFETFSLTDLSNLFAQLVAYKEYADTQLGDLDVTKIALKEKIELFEAKMNVLLPPPEATKKYRIRSDRRYIKLKRELTECKAKIALVSKIVSGAEDEIKLVSREVTIRIGQEEDISATERMNRRKKYVDRMDKGQRSLLKQQTSARFNQLLWGKRIE